MTIFLNTASSAKKQVTPIGMILLSRSLPTSAINKKSEHPLKCLSITFKYLPPPISVVGGYVVKLFDLHPKESIADFFDREEERQRFQNLVNQGRWVAILGQRMVGKSSFVKAALNERVEQVQVVYINLWSAKNAEDMLEQLAIGIQNSKTLPQKIKAVVKSLFLTIPPTPVTIGFERRPLATISNLFSLVGQTKKPTIVVLDEVQKLAPFSGLLHEMLARIFNTYPNMTFVFTGSMFGLIRSMLRAKSTAPMYGRAPVEMRLEPFSEEVAKGFLEEGFEQYGILPKTNEIDEAVRTFGGVPGWLTIYGVSRTVEGCKHDEAIKETVRAASRIMREELDHFLLNKNATLYLAALKSMVVPMGWAEIKRSVEIATKHRLNPRRFQEILNTLQDALLIKQSGAVYAVTDPMLKNVLLQPSKKGRSSRGEIKGR